MKTKKDIKQEVKELVRLSIAEDGQVASERVATILQYILSLSTNKRLMYLKVYKAQMQRYINSHTATIEVAEPLPEEILAQITKQFGKGMVIRVKHNASLIGGVRVTVGDSIYDDSVRGRLQQIATQIH